MVELFFYFVAFLLLWVWSFVGSCERCKILGLTFLGLGFILGLFEVLKVILLGGEANLFQILTVVLLSTFYFTLWKFKRLGAVAFAPLVATLALLFSAVGLKTGAFFGKGPGLFLHVAVSLLAFSLLLLSAVASLMRFFAERRLKEGSIELPLGLPLNFWVRLERGFFFFGFLFLTFDLVINLFLMKENVEVLKWDWRVISTLLLWVYYGILFHLERFGVNPFKERFYLFNLLGGVGILTSLLFARHSF